MNKNYSYLNKVFIMYVSPTTTKNWFHRQNFGIFLIVYTSPWLMLCTTILTQSFAIYFWWSLKTKHRKEAWPVVVGYLHDHLQNYTSACLSCELCLALSSLANFKKSPNFTLYGFVLQIPHNRVILINKIHVKSAINIKKPASHNKLICFHVYFNSSCSINYI